MTIDSLSLKKRLMVTQLLSVFFAFISEIHTRLLIAYDWLFSSYIVFYTEIVILIIIFTILNYIYLDRKWINIALILPPYIIYVFIMLLLSSSVYPFNTTPNNYGIGLLGVFTIINQWFSVLIACFIGTYLKRKLVTNKNIPVKTW